jgi:ribosome-associated protein
MDIRKLQRAIVDGLEDVKAQHIAVFNTEHLSPLFERVIIASGTSNRQTKALASSVRETVKKRGLEVLRTEGEENGEWIIVDCGAAVCHVMQPAIREYYRLEEIWGGKAVKMKVGDGPAKGLVKASSAADQEPGAVKATAKSATKPGNKIGSIAQSFAEPASRGSGKAGSWKSARNQAPEAGGPPEGAAPGKPARKAAAKKAATKAAPKRPASAASPAKGSSKPATTSPAKAPVKARTPARGTLASYSSATSGAAAKKAPARRPRPASGDAAPVRTVVVTPRKAAASASPASKTPARKTATAAPKAAPPNAAPRKAAPRKAAQPVAHAAKAPAAKRTTARPARKKA